jgi:hypothetical protein
MKAAYTGYLCVPDRLTARPPARIWALWAEIGFVTTVQQKQAQKTVIEEAAIVSEALSTGFLQNSSRAIQSY